MPVKYVFDQSERVADFVVRSKIASGATTYAGFPDKGVRAIGIENADKELIAGIVYFNYKRDVGTIDMSVEALPKQRWLTPTTIAIMFQYPFLECGCQEVITRTEARNEHVLRMLAALNFTLIRIPRAAGRHEDGVIAVLTDDDWVASKFCRRYGHHLADIKPAVAA